MPLPFEFVVYGVPRTLQAKTNSKRAWKAKVSRAASQTWPQSASKINTEISANVIYFYSNDILDIDNILKPILDSLDRIIEDDSQISQVLGRKTPINGLVLQSPSPILASAIQHGGDFVYIELDGPPDHRTMP